MFLQIIFLFIGVIQALRCGLEPYERGPCNINEDCHPELDPLNECDLIWGICKCNPNSLYTGEWCNITRYDSSMVGGLQFLGIIGIGGVGDFIIDNNRSGAIFQAVCCPLGILFIAGMMVCIRKNDCEEDGVCGCICGLTFWAFVIYLAGITWTIVDAAEIFSGKIVDQNGYYPKDSECINYIEWVIWKWE